MVIQIFINLGVDITLQLVQMISAIVRSHYNDIVLAANVIIEARVAENAIRIVPRG